MWLTSPGARMPCGRASDGSGHDVLHELFHLPRPFLQATNIAPDRGNGGRLKGMKQFVFEDAQNKAPRFDPSENEVAIDIPVSNTIRTKRNHLLVHRPQGSACRLPGTDKAEPFSFHKGLKEGVWKIKHGLCSPQRSGSLSLHQ